MCVHVCVCVCVCCVQCVCVTSSRWRLVGHAVTSRDIKLGLFAQGRHNVVQWTELSAYKALGVPVLLFLCRWQVPLSVCVRSVATI